MKNRLALVAVLLPCMVSAQSWSLKGNAHLNANNFLGTTDNSQLNIRTNSVNRVSITGTGEVGIGNSSPGFTLDVNGPINIAPGSSLYMGGVKVFSTPASNVYLGNLSGLPSTIANYNTSIGWLSMFNVSSGSYNTATGSEALNYNTTGYYNTAIGSNSLEHTLTNNNTAVGAYSLLNNELGNDNTALGYNTNVNNPNYISNSMALGSSVLISASNQVRIGNNNVTSIGGAVNWSTISDSRVKKNVKSNVPGLAFINKLKPITYNLDLNAIERIVQSPLIKDKNGNVIKPSAKQMEAQQLKGKIIYSGFEAQDVQKAAGELQYEFSGVDAAQNTRDLYSLRYADFVVPLVKAVQELSTKNDSLQQQIANLEERLSKIESLIPKRGTVSSQNTTEQAFLTEARIDQNSPNPYSRTTTINYFLPVNNGNAFLNIYNVDGTLVKSVKLNATGKGSININSGEITSGTYHYSLFVDGKLIDTKRMQQLN